MQRIMEVSRRWRLIRRALLLVVATLFASAPRSARAQVLFDNGVPDNRNGLDVGGGFTRGSANDFSLAADGTVSSFTWWVLHWSDAPTVTSSYSWAIRSDDGGVPGAIIASGSAESVLGERVPAYGCCGYGPPFGTANAYEFTESVGAVPLMGSVTYWLSIVDYAGALPGKHWSSSNGYTGNAMWDSAEATWNTANQESAFCLSGTEGGCGEPTATPEPSASFLLGAGIVLVIMRRRLGSAAKMPSVANDS